MTKARVDVFIGHENYIRLLTFQHEAHLKSISMACDVILTRYFKGRDEQLEAVTRLQRVIISRDDEIKQLKSEIDHLKIKGKKK